MRIAVFADTHGNPYSTRAVLKAISDSGSFDAVVAAGDVCSGGSDPAACVDMLQAAGFRRYTGMRMSLFSLHPKNRQQRCTDNPDTHLVLTFPSEPTLGNSGQIRIYDAADDRLVDLLDLSIPPGPTTFVKAPASPPYTPTRSNQNYYPQAGKVTSISL